MHYMMFFVLFASIYFIIIAPLHINIKMSQKIIMVFLITLLTLIIYAVCHQFDLLY